MPSELMHYRPKPGDIFEIITDEIYQFGHWSAKGYYTLNIGDKIIIMGPEGSQSSWDMGTIWRISRWGELLPLQYRYFTSHYMKPIDEGLA